MHKQLSSLWMMVGLMDLKSELNLIMIKSNNKMKKSNSKKTKIFPFQEKTHKNNQINNKKIHKLKMSEINNHCPKLSQKEINVTPKKLVEDHLENK